MFYDEKSDYIFVVTKTELNSIIKSLKLRKEFMEKTLQNVNHSLRYRESMKEAIEVHGELIAKLIYQKHHPMIGE